MNEEIDLNQMDWVPDADSGDGIVRSFEQCQAWAEALKCTLRLPGPEELFLDLDSEEAWTRFQEVFPVFGKHFASGRKWKYDCVVTPSKSGLPKRHVVVRLRRKDHSLVEKIALQAALGSDGRREVLSILRASQGEENVVVFFESKVPEAEKAVPKVELWDYRVEADDLPF